MRNDIKICYLDVETTGVYHWKHGVIQIAGIIEINGKEVQRFDFKVKPHPKAKIDAKALEVNRTNLKQLEDYPEQAIVMSKLENLFKKHVDSYDKQDKMFFCGYNSAFDVNFVRAFYKQCGNNYFGSYFYSGSLDVMVLALEYLKEDRNKMENFKLMTVAERLGIKIDETKAHDALYDIEITRDIYKLIKSEESFQSKKNLRHAIGRIKPGDPLLKNEIIGQIINIINN